MKRALRILFLTGVLMLLLCAAAFAADEAKTAGIYGVTINSDITGVTVEPQDASGKVEPTTVAIKGADIEGFYAGAVKLLVTVPTTSESQYLVLALSGTSPTPTEENIVYIDQNGNGSFTVYPSKLGNGEYNVYVTSNTDASYNGMTKVASFQYYAPYMLGDVDGKGSINSRDAQFILQYSVGLRTLDAVQMLAADVDRDGRINSRDAQLVLQASVGLRTLT